MKQQCNDDDRYIYKENNSNLCFLTVKLPDSVHQYHDLIKPIGSRYVLLYVVENDVTLKYLQVLVNSWPNKVTEFC